MNLQHFSNSNVEVDNFNREFLGSTWNVRTGDVGIVDQCDLGVLTKLPELMGLGIATWCGSPLTSDQFCEVTISTKIDQRAICQVFVRRRPGDKARYGFYCLTIDEYGRPAGTSIWGLKLDGIPGGTTLATIDGPKLSAGDTFRIEAKGNLIKGFHNGKLLLSAVDSSLTEPGEPGVAMNVYWVERFPSPFFSRWRCGNLLE